MWDFDIGRTLAIMARTWPYIALRMVVYFGITIAYVLATGVGAGVGYGTAHVSTDPDAPLTFALWGGVGGFVVVSAVVYWLREYILYIVKAGHIAVMVRLVDGRDLPAGEGQIAFGRRIVTERFLEANALFVLDQLVKGAVRAITGLIGGFASVLPIPGLHAIASLVNGIIRISLTYVDEIILAHIIRLESSTPFETARKGVVLYAQNAGTMLRNAVWLAVFIWLITLVLFLVMLAPAAALLYAMPGQLAGWSFAFAIVFAWALKAALVEPFAIAALMAVYFRTIEGQVPDPEWDAKLAGVSRHFRQMKDRAVAELR